VLITKSYLDLLSNLADVDDCDCWVVSFLALKALEAIFVCCWLVFDFYDVI